MYPPDLQSEFIGQEAFNQVSPPQEPEQYLGHYIDDLETSCNTKYLDAQEAITLLQDLLPVQPSQSQAAAARYIEQYLLSQTPLPF